MLNSITKEKPGDDWICRIAQTAQKELAEWSEPVSTESNAIKVNQSESKMDLVRITGNQTKRNSLTNI
jgi:hypothetical protein